MLDLLFGKPKQRAAAGGSDGGWWPSLFGGMGRLKTQAGPVVDQELALTYSAVWCCSRILAEAMTMPKDIYQRLGGPGGDDRKIAYKHPIRKLITLQPNPKMGSVAFRTGRAHHSVNWGNGFGEIEFNGYREAVGIWPIHAGRVRPVWPPDDLYSYYVMNNDGSPTKLKHDEMYHVPGPLSEDGIWGKAVIPYARESIGLGLATERHGASFFGAGGRPPGVLTIPGMKDAGARATFRSEWKQIHGNPDSGEIVILPPEGKFVPISIPNEAAQFLETRGHNVEEICRWYGVPPHMCFRLDRATWSNVEQLGIEFVIYYLLPRLRLWEEQDNLKLLQDG